MILIWYYLVFEKKIGADIWPIKYSSEWNQMTLTKGHGHGTYLGYKLSFLL